MLQLRGYVHLHEICWVPNGHDLWKIFGENSENTDKINREIDKIHNLYNRYVSSMNYTTKQRDKVKIDKEDIECDQEKNESVPWFKKYFVKKNYFIESLLKDDKYYHYGILELLDKV